MPPAAMTPAETEQFLRRCRHVVVATRSRDGYPVPAVAAVANADVLELQLAPDSAVEGLYSDPSLCVVADEWPTYDEIKGVIAHGRVTPRVGDAHSDVLHLRLELDRITTFDFGKPPTS